MFSQIKDRKHIEQNFHSAAGIMFQGWDLGLLGGGGGGDFSVGICDGAPSTAHSSLVMLSYMYLHKLHGLIRWMLH